MRDTIHPSDRIEVFNKVRGWVQQPDGTKYTIRASADFVLENGVPTTSPEDFVTFKMREVRWKPWW